MSIGGRIISPWLRFHTMVVATSFCVLFRSSLFGFALDSTRSKNRNLVQSETLFLTHAVILKHYRESWRRGQTFQKK